MELDERSSERAWYVVHTYSGYENKVKANLERKIESQGLQDVIFQVVVPVEDDMEEKDGKQKLIKRKIFPGYVLVEMIVNNHSWYIVRNTQGVTGFVGTEKEPIPLSDAEAEKILSSMKKEAKTISVLNGDTVRIKDGWFKDKTGVVKEVDASEGTLKVEVEGNILELEADNVEKV
ncbi:MAG: transcription termination/antitermination factor NusG [Selenomonadaceae bacterium]|jgi:transcriptional antiterminator NusG|nr:transcription termination/antitermination factor NusG [Selenomonadaceae bacterium]